MLEGMNHAYAKALKEQGETAANQMLFDQSRRFSLILRSIETSGKPWAEMMRTRIVDITGFEHRKHGLDDINEAINGVGSGDGGFTSYMVTPS